MTSYAILKNTLVGELLLVASATHLVGIYFAGSQCAPPIEDHWTRNPDHPLVREASTQLGEYLAGSRRDFTVPLSSQGTPFQKEIWRQIAQIPFGQTITYSELARRAGARAPSAPPEPPPEETRWASSFPATASSPKAEPSAATPAGLSAKGHYWRLKRVGVQGSQRERIVVTS